MITKKIFKITGMHCTSCAMNIDGELEDTKGVIAANTNYAKAETEVKFDTEKLKEEHIVGVIKSTGYDAKPISK